MAHEALCGITCQRLLKAKIYTWMYVCNRCMYAIGKKTYLFPIKSGLFKDIITSLCSMVYLVKIGFSVSFEKRGTCSLAKN